MPFRPNVAGIICREDSKILVAERLKHTGSWQFPQGGVDEGESLENAFFREIREELGIKSKHLRILDQRGWYRYKFPGDHLKKNIYDGQKQMYFLALFVGNEKNITVNTPHPEFAQFQWIKPAKFKIKWLPEFKREVYRQVMRDFFEIEL